jgi:hypothetical protein
MKNRIVWKKRSFNGFRQAVVAGASSRLGLALGVWILIAGGAFAKADTIGGGTLEKPAQGPAPAYGIGGKGFILVKNWDFGAKGTIKNMADMSANFQYHDHYGLYSNGGGNYGALTVAPDAADAVSGQPVEGPGVPKVREFTDDSLKTFIVPLHGATTLIPKDHNAGCGSFQAKWTLPAAGSALGQDMIWETRVRYDPPKYFWYSHWIDGPVWSRVEIDVIESFGYDNGGGATNFDGRYWHSAIGLGTSKKDNHQAVKYGNWANAMASVGIKKYDAGQYHTWTLFYGADNSVAIYVDGVKVQWGSLHWTVGGAKDAKPMDAVFFLFDATWAHTKVPSVNKPLPATELKGKYFEFDYSRVYLRPAPQP